MRCEGDDRQRADGMPKATRVEDELRRKAGEALDSVSSLLRNSNEREKGRIELRRGVTAVSQSCTSNDGLAGPK